MSDEPTGASWAPCSFFSLASNAPLERKVIEVGGDISGLAGTEESGMHNAPLMEVLNGGKAEQGPASSLSVLDELADLVDERLPLIPASDPGLNDLADFRRMLDPLRLALRATRATHYH
jgi:hypothetical protein